jgi:hypothetical protein
MKLFISLIAQYLFNIFLAVDQALNTLLLGHPDETLSSRLGRTIGKERYFWVSPLRAIVDLLFFFDVEYLLDGRIKNHCEKSIMPLEQENFREMVDYEIWSWSK